jgi:hypothetical protein
VKKTLAFYLLGLVYLSGNAQTLTYYDTIKSIFKKNCSQCHHKKGIGPFSLDSYEQILANKNTILSVIENNKMPPWKADTSYFHFINERVLSKSEKQQLISWINGGCEQGIDNNPVTMFTQSMGTPVYSDINFSLPVPLKINAGISDTIINIEIPYELPRDTFIETYQFVPAKNSGIAHAWFHILDASKPVDEYSPETMLTGEFWNGSQFVHRSYSSKYLAIDGEWLPGQLAVTMPPGIGFFLPKKGILIYRVHFGPSTVSYTSNFELQITFAKNKVERIPTALKYGSGTKTTEPYPPLIIPPDTTSIFNIEATIPYKCSVLSITPHMNFLGKSFKAWVVKPTGDTLKLINIENWDPNWQGHYFPPALIVLEIGDVVQAEISMDNTAGNIHNQNHPPKFVRYGTTTKDEVIELSIYAVPFKKGDELLQIKPDESVLY